MIRPISSVCIFVALILTGAPMQSAFAQSSPEPDQEATRSLGGPEGVSPQIDRSLEDRDSAFDPNALRRGMQSYHDWKQRLKDEHGFGIGFQAYWLYQSASDTLGSEDDAWGQIYRLQGNWTLFG